VFGDSVDDRVAHLRATMDVELVGEVAKIQDKLRLSCMQAPWGIIVALAEELQQRGAWRTG
jgi:hypothetical protein